MKVGSTLRSYVTATMGPWIIAINRILNDANGFIQSNVNAANVSANSAADSATAAAASQTGAATAQTIAQASATSATSSATSASQSVTTVSAIVISLNKIYLGAKASDPSVDNNGDQLIDGATYLNTTDNPEKIRIYENGAWTDSDQAVDTVLQSAQVSAAAAAASENDAANYAAEALAAELAAQAAALAAANSALQAAGYLPTLGTGTAACYLRSTVANNGFELRTAVQVLNDIGAASTLSPILTGEPTAPTADQDTASEQLATTNFVLNQASAIIPATSITLGSIGASLRYARADHAHPTDTTRASVTGSIQQAFTGSIFQAAWGVPLGNGVVSTGGYSFANDSVNDTGMYSNADGVLYFYNNGVLSFGIDANNVLTVNKTLNVLGALNSKGSLNLSNTGSSVSFITAANSNGFVVANATTTLLTVDDQGNADFAGAVTATDLEVQTITAEGAISFSNLTSRIFYDATNKYLSIQSGQFYSNFKTDGSLSVPNGISSGGVLSGTSLSLGVDSSSSLGNLELYGLTPHINFHYNKSVAPSVQLINDDTAQLSIINSSGGYVQAQFGATYWTLSYATTTTSGFRMTGQNNGTLSVIQDVKSNGSTTSTPLYSLSATVFTIGVPVTMASGATFGNQTTFNAIANFNYDLYLAGAAIRLNAESAKMTLDQNTYNWIGSSGTPVLTVDTTPSKSVITAYAAVDVPSLVLTGGTVTSSIYKDPTVGNIKFQMNDGTSNYLITFSNVGGISAAALTTPQTGGITTGLFRTYAGLPGTNAAGSVGYSFVGEAVNNTGMFSDSPGQLYLYSNGTAFITLNGATSTVAGSVAVGVPMNVTGSFGASVNINAGAVVTAGGAVVSKNTSGQGFVIGALPTGTYAAIGGNMAVGYVYNLIQFYINGVTKFSVDYQGNVLASQVRANQGLPASGACGFTFGQDSSYDTGMFSDGDGQLYLFSNGTPYVLLNGNKSASLPNTIQFQQATTFNAGASVPTPALSDSSVAVTNTSWVTQVLEAYTDIQTRYGNMSTSTSQAADVTFTITVPVGFNKMFYRGLAAGGGGANCQGTASNGNISGGGGGSGGFSEGYFTVSAGAVYTVTLGASGPAQTQGGVCKIADANGNNIVTLYGGSGSVFQRAGSSAGGIGGIFSINPGVQQIDTFGGGDGSDGMGGAGFVFAGNGAPGKSGANGRAGAQGGEPAHGAGSGGGGAYDNAMTGTLYYGGPGGVSMLNWSFSV